MKIIRRDKNPKNKKMIDENEYPNNKSEDKVDVKLSKSVEENLKKFKAFLEDSTDIVFREFKLGIQQIPCALVYVDGLINNDVVNNQILKTMIYQITTLENDLKKPVEKNEAFDIVKDNVVTVGEIKEADTLDESILMVLSGEVALMVDGFDKVLIVNARGWPSRGIAEPQSEAVLRGPRDGYTETLRVNTSLLRRKCKDPNMVIKTIKVGRRSKTDVSYVYIKGIANPKLVKEMERRLASIDIDEVYESGQIEEWIQDNAMTPFPQLQVTERPDKTIASIGEGRIAVLVDNSPFALIAPVSFYQLFQSPEDYYERWIIASFIRSLRWFASFLAAFTPAIYIAVVSYHPGFIPTQLALSIAASRAGVPFPAFIEAILMEITIELLRESGARLPKPIGQTIGIVGGLIIGDAAVRAGIASPIMIIVVAVTAIASFVIPTYSAAIGLRIIRFPLMLLAAALGLYGVMLGFIILNIHLVSLESFGSNYMAPQAPARFRDWKDFIFRLPYKNLNTRPEETEPIDMDRNN